MTSKLECFWSWLASLSVHVSLHFPPPDVLKIKLNSTETRGMASEVQYNMSCCILQCHSTPKQKCFKKTYPLVPCLFSLFLDCVSWPFHHSNICQLSVAAKQNRQKNTVTCLMKTNTNKNVRSVFYGSIQQSHHSTKCTELQCAAFSEQCPLPWSRTVHMDVLRTQGDFLK